MIKGYILAAIKSSILASTGLTSINWRRPIFRFNPLTNIKI